MTGAVDGYNQNVPGAPWLSAAWSVRLGLSFPLFDGFARLSAERQRVVMDPQAGTGPVLAAMGTQWWRMPARFRPALVAATVRGVADAGSQR